MPLALTDHAVHVGEADGSVTTASFTPSNNSLLCVVGMRSNFTPSSADLSISDTASASWTRHITYVSADIPYLEIAFWTTEVVTGTSRTVTVSAAAGAFATLANVFDFTGYDTTTPVANATNGHDGNSASGTISFNLGAAPASDSYVIGMLLAGQATSIAPGSGYTEMREWNDGGSDHVAHVEYRTSSTSQVVSWSLTNFDDYLSAGVEIQAATAAVASRPVVLITRR